MIRSGGPTSWIIGEELGSGGDGIVYTATRHWSSKKYNKIPDQLAVKITEYEPVALFVECKTLVDFLYPHSIAPNGVPEAYDYLKVAETGEESTTT